MEIITHPHPTPIFGYIDSTCIHNAMLHNSHILVTFSDSDDVMSRQVHLLTLNRFKPVQLSISHQPVTDDVIHTDDCTITIYVM